MAPTHAELDLLDAVAVRERVRELRPERIYHLAAFASARRSWREPQATLRANVEMTSNVLEAAREEAPEARLLIVGSGEIYGPPERLPVDERAPLRPQNPYAVSKATGDLLGGQYADAYGLAVMRSRSFNHVGPGQSDEYVLGTLTRQVAEAEAEGRSEVRLRTGDVDSARDFTDVRDVMRAYRAAVELPPGAYNVCSGRLVSVSELIELVSSCTRLEVRHVVDPALVRPNEVKQIRGSAERLRELTGWEPEIPLKTTVRDALEEWRRVLSSKPSLQHL